MCSQELRKQQTVTRLHDMRRDYTSFLYGFDALPLGEAPDDLSTNQAAVFENANLAHIFFRCATCLKGNSWTCQLFATQRIGFSRHCCRERQPGIHSFHVGL
jgi:hypothetical protein